MGAVRPRLTDLERATLRQYHGNATEVRAIRDRLERAGYKVCSTCVEPQAFDAFNKNQHKCRSYSNAPARRRVGLVKVRPHLAAWRAGAPSTIDPADLMHVLKTYHGNTTQARAARAALASCGQQFCCSCSCVKPVSAFAMNRRTRSGRQGACKACRRKYKGRAYVRVRVSEMPANRATPTVVH